jgi:uncharacterized membrane protein
MAKKFDTNPLDPGYPERVVKETETSALPNSNGATTKFADPVETEEQTRRFREAEFGSFDSSFGQNANQPTSYPPAKLFTETAENKKNLSIGSISLPENILTALPYIPFAYIGVIAGIIELIFIPKSEPKVRYHAAQGIAAHVAIWIVMTVLGILGWGSDLAGVASWIFYVVTTIMLLVFAYKAWKGEPIHIATVQDLTDWLEEKIKPQK